MSGMGKGRQYQKVQTHRFSLKLPEKMIEVLGEYASNVGYISGRKGNVSGYIRLIIIDDLKTKEPIDLNPKNSNLHEGDLIKINISMNPELKEQAELRAEELGFVWGGKGNITAYIKYLITKNIE